MSDKFRNVIKRQGGQQMLATLLIMTAILGIFASALLYMFQRSQKVMVLSMEITSKNELVYTALEHAVYKLQKSSFWYNTPCAGFMYDKEYAVPGGSYTLNIQNGNLFLTNKSDYTTKQAQSDFRTIGIKAKLNSGSVKQFVAVVKKSSFGGPLLSKGTINLPCDNSNSFWEDATNDYVSSYNFYWGDIFSVSTDDADCKIPVCSVGDGTTTPQPWLPEIYAGGAIWTALYNNSSSSLDIVYGYTYDDMSPTAHAHPYSEYSKVPEIDFDYYRMLAKRNASYYGPTMVAGVVNPYSVDYTSNYLLSVLTKSNTKSKIVDKLTSPNSVVFVDTADGLTIYPKVVGSRTVYNTYTGTITCTASMPQSIAIYSNDSNRRATRGSLIVMGPIQFIGDDPDAGESAGYSKITGVGKPDNFYFPQDDFIQGSNQHYWYDSSNLTNCYIDKVKHRGLIYAGGELKLGGARSPSNSTASRIYMYGTLYIGEYGSLTVDTVNDDPTFYIFFDRSQNLFGFTGDKIDIVLLSELTYLIQTPVPVYPAF